jgi:hypothetical protein
MTDETPTPTPLDPCGVGLPLSTPDAETKKRWEQDEFQYERDRYKRIAARIFIKAMVANPSRDPIYLAKLSLDAGYTFVKAAEADNRA